MSRIILKEGNKNNMKLTSVYPQNINSKKEIGFNGLYFTFNKEYLLKTVPKIEARNSDSYDRVLDETKLNCERLWSGLKRIKKELNNSPIKMIISIDSYNNVKALCGLEDKYAALRKSYNFPVPNCFCINGESFSIKNKDTVFRFFTRANTAISVLNPFFKEQNNLISKNIRNKSIQNDQFHRELCEKLNITIDDEWTEQKKWNNLPPHLKELGYKEMIAFYKGE